MDDLGDGLSVVALAGLWADAMTECGRCGADTMAEGYVCAGCAAQWRGYLHDVPELVRQLDLTISRQTSRGDGGTGDGVAYDIGASEALAQLRNVLGLWASRAVGTCGDTVSTAERLLGVRPELLPYGPAMVEQVANASLDGWAVVDSPPERSFIGWCTGTDNDRCGIPLYARSSTGNARCPRCGQYWDVEASREALLRTADDVLAPSSVLARALGIKSATMRSWRYRGLLAQAVRPDGQPARDALDRPLYRLSDAKRLQMGMVPRR